MRLPMPLFRSLILFSALSLTAACGEAETAAATDTSTAVSSRPVRLVDLDAAGAGCASSGTLASAADIMTYPDGEAGTAAELPAGTPVWICERYGASTWYGVLYDSAAVAGEESGEDGNSESGDAPQTAALPACGLDGAAAGRRYEGTCATGWLMAGNVTLERGGEDG